MPEAEVYLIQFTNIGMTNIVYNKLVLQFLSYIIATSHNNQPTSQIIFIYWYDQFNISQSLSI